MADSSKPVLLAVSYSLPQLISASVSIIFTTHLTLLYINTYNWSADGFGKAYALHYLAISIIQPVVVIFLQCVFVTRNEAAGLRNCKIVQIINVSVHARKSFLYLVSLFFLILLPILKLRYNNGNNISDGDLEAVASPRSENVDNKKDRANRKCSLLWKFFNTRWFFYVICFLCLTNGFGFGSFEINNLLIPTYLVRDSTYLFSINSLLNGMARFSTVLLILLSIKLVKNKFPEYVSYFGIGTLFLALSIPVSVLFYAFTQKFSTGSANEASNFVPTTSNLDYPVLAGLFILETVHALLHLSCPIIIQYISTQFLDNNAEFRLYASTSYLLFYFLGSAVYKACIAIVQMPKKTVSFMCIAFYSISYLLFFPHRYSWNKNGIIYYVVLALFNIFLRVGFINTNIILTNQLADDNHKKYRWTIQGCIYCFKNLTLYFLMNFIYSTYDREKLQIIGDNNQNQPPEENSKPSTARRLEYNFSNLFIAMYVTCQIASIIATSVYKEHKFD